MRYSKYVKGLDRATCCYCQYSKHPFMKPTDLWSNLGLELKMCKARKNCHHEKRKQPNGKRGGVMGANHIDKRYAIPAELIESILDQAYPAGNGVINKIEIPKRKKRKLADMMSSKTQDINSDETDYKQLYLETQQDNADLNRLYRKAEDELAKVKAEFVALKKKGGNEPKPKPKQKEVRAWCREKYGEDWYKEDKVQRKAEAKKALAE